MQSLTRPSPCLTTPSFQYARLRSACFRTATRKQYVRDVLQPRASVSEVGWMIAEAAGDAVVAAKATDVTAKAGDVAAPPGALLAGAAFVTLGALLSALLLKPGTDAAIDMQKRDQKKWKRPP